ncbi:3-oxoacid CoA-transferase, B subunit [Rickettsia felis str. Pedreira]|uniref:3-oxoacid CoA-transferase, B subunit n=2 Tax=Rickettsia felis TaxID=42862 RepID=A0A0F3MSH2_RICFI|nr:3-oxoacid CoA-transferase subunit B [Rickettsia felis]AAY61224.1 Succinyl-CoA:3-ketoacid-coenzyme A transferase subunit B [Rickettsia felis URRWXCal2]KHO03224.1 succinyl-CoA:3-ketoacid-CoA transferase [Rickettsia felis str. LSU]KHO03909.1 succinyl-CoA:3-ketoacid-CoA transferase [Rickettsia felis]KJV58407.1 3-oxoacid CoA-transferase, B subunit [Rickettsia felis str. Pedreira]MDE8611458.1 3-oxoacid CoA-transferase subunit B [Rickettsia felis]
MAWSKEEIYQITAEELKDGLYVNLGIGMPTHVANYIPKGVNVIFQSENGMLGMGPFPYKGEEDPDLINAGKQTITAIPESSYFDSSFSFGMIRGSHVDLTILGAMQVSQKGDLANWTIPGKMVKGMGGAMDLVANTKRVVIIMEHNAKDGGAKLLKECSFPLTGKKVVNRIITDLGIFDIDKDEMILVRKADDVTIEEIKSKTEAEFIVGL